MRIAAENSGNTVYAQNGVHNAQSARSFEKSREAEGTYDQLKLSRNCSSESIFHKELAARLVQEVRTSTTTGDIQQLREQVLNGSYRINPSAIASAMLLGDGQYE